MGTAAIIIRGIGIVIAGRLIGAAGRFIGIANAVLIRIGSAVSTTHAQGVELVAIAVAVSSGNVFTTTVVNGTRPIADATSIVVTYAVVHVVANAIIVGIGSTISATDVHSIELVAVAVTIAHWNIRTSAIVDFTRSIAHTAGIQCTDAIIDVVANAIGICIGRAGSSADIQGIKLVSIAVAITRWNV